MLLEAKDALLIVIDMQEKLLPVISGREEVQRNCAILMQAARLVGAPVLVTEQYPKGLGHTAAELAGLADPADIVSEVEFSCAGNADVMTRIEAHGRKQLVLCGVEAHPRALTASQQGRGSRRAPRRRHRGRRHRDGGFRMGGSRVVAHKQRSKLIQ